MQTIPKSTKLLFGFLILASGSNCVAVTCVEDNCVGDQSSEHEIKITQYKTEKDLVDAAAAFNLYLPSSPLPQNPQSESVVTSFQNLTPALVALPSEVVPTPLNPARAVNIEAQLTIDGGESAVNALGGAIWNPFTAGPGLTTQSLPTPLPPPEENDVFQTLACVLAIVSLALAFLYLRCRASTLDSC